MPATGFYFVSESQTFKQSEFSSVSKFSFQEINRKSLVRTVTLQEISSSEGNLTKTANFHRCIKKNEPGDICKVIWSLYNSQRRHRYVLTDFSRCINSITRKLFLPISILLKGLSLIIYTKPGWSNFIFVLILLIKTLLIFSLKPSWIHLISSHQLTHQ